MATVRQEFHAKLAIDERFLLIEKYSCIMPMSDSWIEKKQIADKPVVDNTNQGRSVRKTRNQRKISMERLINIDMFTKLSSRVE